MFPAESVPYLAPDKNLFSLIHKNVSKSTFLVSRHKHWLQRCGYSGCRLVSDVVSTQFGAIKILIDSPFCHSSVYDARRAERRYVFRNIGQRTAFLNVLVLLSFVLLVYAHGTEYALCIVSALLVRFADSCSDARLKNISHSIPGGCLSKLHLVGYPRLVVLRTHFVTICIHQQFAGFLRASAYLVIPGNWHTFALKDEADDLLSST